MQSSTGQQILSKFHDEYFNEKVVSDWYRKKFDKFQKTNPSATLRSLTEPVEEEVDDLVVKLASLSDQPTHKTQSLLRHVDDEVFTALIMRWAIVTEYFQKNADKEFPHSEYLSQSIIDFLTNYWRWIKEQPTVEEIP